jgi:glycosyltransferase involved in cell wall biosynthesis
MKVLNFYKTYLPDSIGGAEQVINQIARGVEKSGISTEVLALSPKKVKRAVKINGHLVHRCKSNFEIASTPFSASAIFRFKQLAKKADIIHYHYPYPFADLLHFVTQVNKPTVLTYHSDIVKQKYLLKLYQPLMNKFLDSVDYIVSTSPNYLKSSKVLARFKNKVSVIPIGLDKFAYPTPKKDRLEYWQKKFGNKFFLFVGVIRYYKGLHVMIEAAQNSNYPIVIAGMGPAESELKEQVKKLDIRNIYFIGFVSDEDKVALLALSYAILFPSHLRSEAFGISLLEGAMFGKPLISCEIGTGTTYINIDGKTGIVVPPSDPGALRNAMDYLWNNPKLSKMMGGNAEKRYWDLFTANKMAKSYVNLYKSLLQK